MGDQRKLTALLVADVVGYSRLVGLDESGTVSRVKQLREQVLEPALAAQAGRLVKTMGDGFLAEFPSIVDAARCAVGIQEKMIDWNGEMPADRKIQLRIGVHIGDVMIDGEDLLGDGVNVTARLQTFAEPGSICLSANAHHHIEGKLPIVFEDLGEQMLKNIARPIRVFRWLASKKNGGAAEAQALPLPNKPSIAVLAFTNMSGDPEQEFIADGIAEDLITGLSRIRWLFVIARNSTFVYKGRAVDVKQIARELGVRYVLEGSVRRAGNRLRITGQLVDATTGENHWAERYDRELGDIFALQDEITRTVAGAIEPRMLAAEGVRFSTRSASDLGAWELVTRALSHFARLTQADTLAGIEFLSKATERYPNYAPAHALLGFYFVLARHMGWIEPAKALADAREHATRAAELDESDPRVHMGLGYLALMERKTAEMIRAFSHAVELNPNSAMAVGGLGFGLAHTERDQEAIAYIDESVRLSPHDPHNVLFFGALSLAHYLAGRFDKAIEAASLAVRLRPGFQGARRLLCASLAQTGREEEARGIMQDIRRAQPDLSLEWVRKNVPIQTPEQMERFLDGLRKSGLTE